MPTYSLIQSATVGAGGQAAIEFTSIPATYTDLVLSISTRNDYSGNDATRILLRFNGASNDADQTFLRLAGDGTTVFSDTGSEGHVAWMNQNGSTANTFSTVEVYIPKYAGSDQKVYSAIGGNERNITTTAYFGFFANVWTSTSAINAIKILSGSSYNLVQYSTAYLYGISNA
jgi:hypothetical protein